MQVELRPRTLGENIGLTFQLSLSHFVKLVVVYGLIQTPLLLLQLVIEYGAAPATDAEDLQTGLIVYGGGLLLVMMILGPVGTGAGTAIVAQSFTGVRVSMAQALGIGFSRLGSLLCYGLVTTIIIAALPFLVVLVAGLTGAWPLAFLAILLILWPGLLFMMWYYVGNAAIIVERIGFGEAMARSKDLSENKRIEVFGLFLVVTLVAQFAAGTLGGILGIASELIPDLKILAIVVGWVAGVVAGVLVVVAPVVMYFSLRCEKDGMDVTGLAELVDEIGRRGGS